MIKSRANVFACAHFLPYKPIVNGGSQVAVVQLEISRRSLYAGGESFGDVGAYEQIDGTIHYAVDPLHPANDGIVDLKLAPRDSNGKVLFSSDFTLLKPERLENGNGSVLYDVVNRGRKTVPGRFNNTGKPTMPSDPLDPGNGFLMRHGYSVLFGGWQADVPRGVGLIGLQAPEAFDADGNPISGRIMCQFQATHFTQFFLLADRQHAPHPAIDANEQDASLTVRDHPNSAAEPIARDKWRFMRFEDESIEPDPCHIFMEEGFEPGRIYQLVYTTRGSSIVGLGFAAMRDIVSFLKYGSAEEGNPCAGGIQRAHAFGASQSGRFLRHYIHTGLNTDENGNMALDGIISHVAGGMRGEFNLRFGQPSKDVCYIIPELFPFSDTEQSDPVTGDSGSLLDRLHERGHMPKIMFTNTSAEYWRGDAALIHTNFADMSDAPEESDYVRRYHFAGSPHGSGSFPPLGTRADGIRGQLPFNIIDYNPLLRASLENLDEWVRGGKPAPASRHPRISDGTAVESHTLASKFMMIPGVAFPEKVTRAMRLDYGPEKHLGRTTTLPPVAGEEFPALVSNVDEDCNEIGGIRLPDLTVPVATYTGWNLRHPDIGAPGLVIGITGGLAGWVLPFPATTTQRAASRDPRPAIRERYASKDDYVSRTESAAQHLVDEGYMLEEDIQGSMRLAAVRYDYFSGNGGTNGSG